MRLSNMSILGLYHYDSHIFDNFALPSGVDDETLFHNLLTECAELEILYPDAGFMKLAIEAWSNKQLHVWEELYKTTSYEYNPIWNKDGTITFTETEGRNITGNVDRTEDRSGTSTAAGSSSRDGNTGRSRTGQSDNKQNVAAINSSNLEPQQQNKISESENENLNTNEKTRGATNVAETTRTAEKEDSTTHENIIRTHSRTEQGNIGITSTQSLIKEQRDVSLFNIYDYIIDDFKKRFCLLIY